MIHSLQIGEFGLIGRRPRRAERLLAFAVPWELVRHLPGLYAQFPRELWFLSRWRSGLEIRL